MLKKADSRKAVSGCEVPVDPVMAKELPCLYDYLTQVEWEDRSARLTATLTISTDQGRFVACLKDRAMSRIAWTSAETFQGLLAALDDALADERLEWRRDQWAANGKKKS